MTRLHLYIVYYYTATSQNQQITTVHLQLCIYMYTILTCIWHFDYLDSLELSSSYTTTQNYNVEGVANNVWGCGN